MKVVLITLAATLLIQIGYFLWKLSASGQAKIGGAPFKVVVISLVTDWRWVLGFLATSFGWLLFVQATAIGDISLVQPLMSAGDLLLVFMAVLFLKERLGTFEWGGVLLTVLGATFLAIEGQDSLTSNYVGKDLLILLTSLVLVGVLMFANRKRIVVGPEVLLALVVGLCFGTGAILTKAMTSNLSVPGEPSLRLLIDPLLPAVVLANVLGLVFLQAAFQRGRAAVIVPLQLAMCNVVTVVAGISIFSENITFYRGLGIVLIVIGTGLLQIKKSREQNS